jgi:hypothetical protein
MVNKGHCTVSYMTVCRRIRSGWEVIDALLTPETKRGRAKGCTNVKRNPGNSGTSGGYPAYAFSNYGHEID